MMKKYTLQSCLALAACMALAPMALSCVEKESKHVYGVHAFIVKTMPENGDYGSVFSPLKYPTAFSKDGVCPSGETCFDISVGAYAVDIEGNFLPEYNDTVTLSAEPGKVSSSEVTFVNGLLGQWEMVDGKPTKLIEGQKVGIRFTHGNVRIWVEDSMRKLKTATEYGLCFNDRETEDGVYCEPTLATGVSEEYVFEPQTVKMIQYNPEQKDGPSPLLKEYGQLKARKGHDLVVTNVVSTGFYITDLGDPDYNSLFIFTYSQPGRVEIGDRVCEVSGGIAEFTGMTQLQFPSWGIQNKERSTAEDIDPAPEDGEQGVGSCVDKETGIIRDCTEEELEAMNAIVDCSDQFFDHELTKAEKKAFAYLDPPAPRILSSDILKLNNVSDGSTGSDGNKLRTNPDQTNALERLEGAVVTVQDIRLSTDFVNCDDNGNGKIESNSEEADCRTDCQSNSTRCTEISNLESYDQWKAWTIEGEAEVSVASSSLIAGFDITKGCLSWIDPVTNRRMMRCPERHLKRLTGNLKQVLPGCSGSRFCYSSGFRPSMIMTVIEPRLSTDLIMDEEFNAESEKAFEECVNDKECLAACKEYGGACTCDKFEEYRRKVPSKDPNAPTSCLNRAVAQ
ncbi:MAG: hypothetical protein IJM59_05190 [Proteobacteria bacterium]|nr:hypothetical protein [Pseudomonadota bacterium]